MPENFKEPIEDIVARQTLEIERLKDALALLGVSQCSWCKKFYRRSEAGSLFDAGELVCYPCIREWWPHRCPQLNSKERENLEGKLVFWLRDYHHAETFKDPAKLPEASDQELHIIANCLECKGMGKSLGQESCRFCEGRGTVWVIVSRKKG
jgi:hypothetical protein